MADDPIAGKPAPFDPEHAGELPPAGEDPTPTRCGFIAINGAPNAGKSTLINALVGSKVSIVSHKVQTTRVPIRGIAIEGQSQLVFIDTPGIFAPRRRLDQAMVDAAWTGAGEADRILLIIDAARGLDEDAERMVDRMAQVPSPKILVLNKVDRLDEKERLLPLVQSISARLKVETAFMISALNGDGVAALKSYLAETVPAGPWHYPEDEISDMPMRVLAAEITRERILTHLHDELPYQITVETEQWKELRDKSVRIEQTIYVERDSQKKIVLGKGGDTVKRISSEARAEIARLIEQKVHLFIFVKVRENWGNDPERYREMGLPFPKS
jgi:GTP-binding protein Era